MKIEGMRECREALDGLSKAVQRGVGKRALRRPAQIFVSSIKSKASVSSRADNPTPGSMRDAIQDVDARTRKGVSRRTVLVADPAAVPNEFGLTGRDYPAQPFMRPGIDSAEAEATRAMADDLTTEVEAAARRSAKRGGK